MPQQVVTMESLPQAFEVVKEMPAGGLGRGLSPARPPGAGRDHRGSDGRGGGPLARRPRWQRPARPALPAERAWRHRAQRATHPARLPDLEVLKSCARRAPEIDRAILAGFVPGLSTRKVGEVLLALLGRPVSAATVSRVARTLDLSLAAFHRRPLKNACKALMLDGKKESIDVPLAAKWERRPVGALPHRAAPPRASPARASEMIGVDGGQGLIAALPIVCHTIPVQRGGAHTIRTILDKVRKADQEAIKAGLHAVMNAPQPPQGRDRRTPLRRRLGRYRPQGRRLPAQRSRRPAPLLRLQDPRPAKAGQNHQRH